MFYLVSAKNYFKYFATRLLHQLKSLLWKLIFKNRKVAKKEIKLNEQKKLLKNVQVK